MLNKYYWMQAAGSGLSGATGLLAAAVAWMLPGLPIPLVGIQIGWQPQGNTTGSDAKGAAFEAFPFSVSSVHSPSGFQLFTNDCLSPQI